MKAIIAFAMLSLAISANAQFRLVGGKVYSLTDSQAGWTVFYDPLRVRGFYNNDVICQSYHDTTVNDPVYKIANRTLQPTHNERNWGQKIVLRNYPNMAGLNIGDDIGPPRCAMRVGDANVTSSQREAWHSIYNSSYGSSTASTTYGADENILVFDMGTPFTPKLTPEQIAAERKKQAKQDVKSFRWLQIQATNGDAWAQCTLGQRYLSGQGTKTNREVAIYWLKLAASQGYADSSNVLYRLENPVTNSITDD